MISDDDEDERGEHDDQPEGDRARGQDDRAQHLVVHDVEDVVEDAEQAIDEVGFVLFAGVGHAMQLTGSRHSPFDPA